MNRSLEQMDYGQLYFSLRKTLCNESSYAASIVRMVKLCNTGYDCSRFVRGISNCSN